jgi:hypothetical protein
VQWKISVGDPEKKLAMEALLTVFRLRCHGFCLKWDELVAGDKRHM